MGHLDMLQTTIIWHQNIGSRIPLMI